MDSLSSNAMPVETPPSQEQFSQLAAFAQKICSLGPPLIQAVQAASTNMVTSLSRTASGRVRTTGTFNIGVGTEGVDIEPEGPQVGRAVPLSSEVSLSGLGILKREVKLIKNSNREIDEDEGPLFLVKFLQGCREIICGGIVASGEIFSMTRVGD